MHDCPLISRSTSARRSSGFTLIELLVTIGIIIILIGILLPVFHKVRIKAQEADTRNWVSELAGAIDRYQLDFHAYPGPFGNNDIYYANFNGGPNFSGGLKNVGASGFDPAALNTTKITMSENLVLGLLGGLHPDSSTQHQLDYDPSKVGAGPSSLYVDPTTGFPVSPKQYPAYIDSKQLSWRVGSAGKTGQYQDDAGAADDSIIPEFVDRFGDPMPILYMRAKVGVNLTGTFSDTYNPIVTDDIAETATPAPRAGAYDLSQIEAYVGAFSTIPWSTAYAPFVHGTAPTGKSIGVGKSISSPYTAPPAGGNIYHGLMMQQWTAAPYPPTVTLQNQYPYDAYPYLVGASGQARQKDGYILISAGADRVYGTDDDICNFGTVGQ